MVSSYGKDYCMINTLQIPIHFIESLVQWFFTLQGVLSPTSQAYNQACASGVAKLSQRNHMVQNLRAYFILYVIKWMCVDENINFSSMSQRPRWSSKQNFRRPLLSYKVKAAKNTAKGSLGWQKVEILLPRGGICHPMTPHVCTSSTHIHQALGGWKGNKAFLFEVKKYVHNYILSYSTNWPSRL